MILTQLLIYVAEKAKENKIHIASTAVRGIG